MSESKSKFFIPAIGAAVVVAGSVVAYMYLKGPSGDSSGALGSAKLVPSTALMATYITTDSEAWEKLQQFGTPEAQKLLAKSLEDFNKNTFKGSDISYEKDIKPWVGGVMFAVLPPNAAKPAQLSEPSNPANPPITLQQEPKILMVVGIKDKISALNFAKRLKEQKNVKSQESDYKGEKITETIENGKPTYSAVLNNSHIVLAPEKQAVENAIDTYKGQPSFASKEGASSILSKGVDVKNTLAQIYVPDYAGMVQQLIAASPQAKQVPQQTLAQLKQVKSMAAAVGVDDAGVRMKAIANLDPQLSKFQYQTTPANIVAQFPIETFALVNGKDISRSWSTIVEQSKDYPELQQALQQMRGQLQTVNIDLDKDIFGWMNGEFAFGAIPSNQGVLASLGFGGALLFDTSDRKTAEATFTKLDTLAKTQRINITQRKIGGKDVTEWQIPQQGALLAHGWLDQDTVFLAIGGPVAESITAGKNQSLENSETFKAVTGSLQKPNGGYFYLDMDKTVSLVNRFAAQGQSIPPETRAILSSIRGVSATATSPDKSISQLEMLLALKPNTAK
ncbi:metalloendopeptidase [Nostoc minutum NIES-26]|uniref:Metalloendopeptidase n=1 Tax=Nostoc minutum NIES-26 TaxID=1844469 RepID=A0A367RXP7_9NOSO|nr:metalloendopeptidase [Nostoc minutum NIES-26]